jgi:dipeptidyl aminopeptidase/acylaminoacyl peptidase
LNFYPGVAVIEMKSASVCWLAGTLLAVSSSLSAARAGVDSRHPFAGKDVFALQWVSEPQIRPDGKSVAYVRQANDIMSDRQAQSLWLVDVATGTETPIGSNEPGTYSSPRWSPDGERLAYLYAANEGTSKLVVRQMKTGESTVIAGEVESPRNIAWSPDGRSIAFVKLVPEPEPTLGAGLNEPEDAHWAEPLKIVESLNFQADGRGPIKPGYSHVFMVSSDGGQARQLTFGRFSESGPLSWSPDGRDLLLIGNRTEGWEREPVDPNHHLPIHLTVFRLGVADGQLTALTHVAGIFRSVSYSADGAHIALLGYQDKRVSTQNLRLQIMDRDGGNLRSVSAALDRSIVACKWAADGGSVFIQYADRGITRIGRMSLDGKVAPVAENLTSGDDLELPYTDGEFSTAAADAVAYTGGAIDRLPELFFVQHGRKPKRLTHLSDATLAAVEFGNTAPLKVSSSFDKQAIDAWMITPPGFDPHKKYPLVLEIHGGPYLSYGPTFSVGHQLFAGAGYIVVYVNPRGSTSYGEAFANIIHDDYPSHDYDDLMSAVDAAIQTGHVDPDNLYVTGHSGGGVLTAWIVGKTGRFRAAATQSPIINWTSGMLASDIYAYVTRYWFDKMPWEAPEAYWKHSPLSLVGNVTTPTLVVVGAADLRTRPVEAEQYYKALELRNVPTAFIEVPGEFHVFERPSHIVGRSNAILAWFERYRH